MFLLSFAVLLLVQFLAMLYHRYVHTNRHKQTCVCAMNPLNLNHFIYRGYALTSLTHRNTPPSDGLSGKASSNMLAVSKGNSESASETNETKTNSTQILTYYQEPVDASQKLGSLTFTCTRFLPQGNTQIKAQRQTTTLIVMNILMLTKTLSSCNKV